MYIIALCVVCVLLYMYEVYIVTCLVAYYVAHQQRCRLRSVQSLVELVEVRGGTHADDDII
jgi:hypothetical protein